jgi:hypothetical protein
MGDRLKSPCGNCRIFAGHGFSPAIEYAQEIAGLLEYKSSPKFFDLSHVWNF